MRMNLREWARATHRTLNSQSAENRVVSPTATQVEQIIRASISTLIEALIAGDQLRIDNLGQLSLETRAPRQIVNNLKNRQEHLLPRRYTIRYRPSKRLIRYINADSRG